jgi:hypothetical protein
MKAHRALQSAVALAAVGLFSVAGCSWIAPGDYKLFKMEISETTQSKGCFYPDSANPNVESDTNSAYDNAIWVITVDSADNVFLDVGSHTLKGTETDDGYTFSEKDVNVDFENNDAKKTKTTRTVSTKITVAIDGKSISGKASTTTSFACDGSNCPPVTPPDCTVDAKFSGTQVDDVQLQYVVK